ncbi:hypothetical protein ACLKA7_013036 [Drosophila subpalustris]
MADTINKPSIQIRSGLPSPLPDKSPSPATKLLISHGKPNFTITRSPSVKDNADPLSAQPNANNNYNAYKSANNNHFVVGTKFNGVFKPSNAAASWAHSNGNGNAAADQNEAAKVVLRRARQADVAPLATPAKDEDDNVPEFIRRQRRIQERLAKENVLDFENRRSGYFTHVMISPDSPNRTSFIETMASPAIVPSLEMPLPARIEEEQQQQQQQQQPTTNGHSEAELSNGHQEEQVQPVSNGHAHVHAHDDVAPEEVAQAIEEVNKAVAGEDDDSKPDTETVEIETQPQVEPVVVVPAAVEAQVEVIAPAAAAESVSVSPPAQNGDAAASHGQDEAITISHTNGHASDPKYGPETVISFAQKIAAAEHINSDAPTDLAKLKFDIQKDDQDEVQVTPVVRSTE